MRSFGVWGNKWGDLLKVVPCKKIAFFPNFVNLIITIGLYNMYEVKDEGNILGQACFHLK